MGTESGVWVIVWVSINIELFDYCPLMWMRLCESKNMLHSVACENIANWSVGVCGGVWTAC